MYINVQKGALKAFRYYPRAKNGAHGKRQALVNPLYSWHVKSFHIHYRRNLLFINDATHLLILITDVQADQYPTIQLPFERILRERLLRIGLDPWQVSRYLKSAGNWQIRPPVNEALSTKLNKIASTLHQLVIHEGFQALVELSNGQREFKHCRLFRTNRLYLFAEQPLWEKSRAKKKEQQMGEIRDAVNQLQRLNDHHSHLCSLTKAQQSDAIQLIQESNAILLCHFISAIQDEYSPRIVRRHQLRLHEHLNHYLASELLTVLSEQSTSLVDLMNSGYPYSEISQTRAALKRLYQFLADSRLISAGRRLSYQRSLNRSLRQLTQIPAQQFEKPTYKEPLTADQDVAVLLAYLGRSTT